ncbi:putative protein PLEKHA9 isoform X2 [Microplitis mediator]|uniref:putative protein PLEKHA9 isoform X2 n=1 Tax=Microplitis mediator TaxID=375433 RepID=UPI00255580F0|nr:putative protein PLEKHA9 isoform X2 [Microplitis mediator]
MSENSNDCNTDNNDENIRHSLELNYGLAIKFPKVINGKINTKNFLAASQAIIKILDKFGKVFAPIKYDMQINIEKIIIKYLANKQEYFTLQDLLLSEQASGKNTIVIDALVWLTRGLRMIQLFIDKIVKNSKAVPAKTGNEAEDLVASVKDSYKESLEPYHGWMAQQLFGLLTRMTPTKSQLMLSLANNLPNQEAITLKALENLSKGLKENLVTLRSFLNENHLVELPVN